MQDAGSAPRAAGGSPDLGIEARRQRVAARLAADAAACAGTTAPAPLPTVVVPEAGTCERQVADSRQQLQTLLANCANELAEARAAGDAREAAHLREHSARNRRLSASAGARVALRAQTTAALEASRARLDELNTPQEVLSELVAQQKACAEEQERKAAVLAELVRDVKLQDEAYEKELDKQGADTQNILQFASVHLASLREAFANEAHKIELSLQQERADFLSAQQAEIDALLAQRNDTERQVAEDATERAIAHQSAIRALRVSGIAECNTLGKEVDDRLQALEQRLASTHATHQLAADQLGVRAHKLGDKDADNNALGQQLKRSIAKQRETLMHNKERWAESDKALRDEYAKLKDDHTRSLTQFQQLDAKHEVLEAADARRRDEVALNDGELLQELGNSCLAAAAELQQLAGIPIDGATPSPDLLFDIATAVSELVETDGPFDAERTLRLLDTLNVAMNSQRQVLDARQATVADITALRKSLAAPRASLMASQRA